MTERLIVEVKPLAGSVKCPRCWVRHYCSENFGHYPEEVSQNPALAQEKLCDSCSRTILDQFPNHASVPGITSAMDAQRQKWTKTPTA